MAKRMEFFSARRRTRFLKVIAFCGVLLFVAHWFWQPGREVRDGRHNRDQNGLWVGHGWLGADAWFAGSPQNQKARFRAMSRIRALASLCAQNGVSDVFPHLCPTQLDGEIAAYDDAQVERFLNNTPHLRVLPWIGGRIDGNADITSKTWRNRFTMSVVRLLRTHPRLSGIHLNIEPWKSGDQNALRLLAELRSNIPKGKILSVSAYPPSDWFYPLRHGWSQAYFRQVAAYSDQMALMTYDSSTHDSKVFQWFVARWTQQSLEWMANSPRKTRLLIGIPTYANAGTRFGPIYHNGRVETLENSLRGVHRGLSHWHVLPFQFQGVAIYAEWETSANEWKSFRREWR